MFVIPKPDVFKSPTAETYIIFGEAKVEDLAAKQAAINAEQASSRAQASQQPVFDRKTNLGSETAAAAGTDEAVDETGVDPKDIQLVMDQAHCSRAKAVTALRNNNFDLVNAIMELTI